MNVYVDSSVLLRVVLGEPDRLELWSAITNPVSSELIRLECLRTIDRARVRLGLDDRQIANYRADVLEAIDAFSLVALDSVVLERAAEPFPTALGSLDAIHLASAEQFGSDLRAFVTYDERLATVASARRAHRAANSPAARSRRDCGWYREGDAASPDRR